MFTPASSPDRHVTIPVTFSVNEEAEQIHRARLIAQQKESWAMQAERDVRTAERSRILCEAYQQRRDLEVSELHGKWLSEVWRPQEAAVLAAYSSHSPSTSSGPPSPTPLSDDDQ